MAEVTRSEFEALAARVSALEGKGAASGPSGATGAATGATAGAGSLSVNAVAQDGAVRVEWTPARSRDVRQYTVGRDGTDTGGGVPCSTTEAAGITSRVFDKLTPGAKYRFTVRAEYTSGEPETVNVVAIPLGTAPAAGASGSTGASGTTSSPAWGSKTVSLVGRSKLPFNSVVFRQTKGDTEAFGSRRGVAMDGLLYFTGRGKWDDFKWHPSGQAEMLAAGLIVVTSMPHAPESEGDQMNQKGANDAYKDQQRALGKWLADNGFNAPNHYIRVDWECNGDWYKWSLNRPGGAAALKAAVKNYVVNLRAGGATKVKFGMCNNKGPNQSKASAFDAFPGAEYIDNMGIDQYDMWAPSYSASDWEREMAKGPSARITAEFARKNGITWSWDEGGNTHGGSFAGGDNPEYWTFRKAEIMRNIGNFAYDCTYDDPGAPASLMHDFARNPKSWDRYRQLWKP